MKKEIKQRAKSDHKKILENNRSFYEKLIAEQYPVSSESENNLSIFSWRKISVIAVSLIILITSTLLAVFLSQSPEKLDDRKIYFASNFINRSVELSEVKQDIKSFSLDIKENELGEVTLIYDSLSGDKIYYRLTSISDDELEDSEILIDINPFFSFDYSEDLYSERKEINSYIVNFSVKREEDDGIYIFVNEALIKLDHETIWISYTCLTFEENGNTFLDWLSETIK